MGSGGAAACPKPAPNLTSVLHLPSSPPRSTNDDFFELGGTSLLAGRINSDVRRKLGVDMSSELPFSGLSVA